MRIESVSPQPVRTEQAEQLKNVEVGDVIKGKVIEATENTVTIKTPGGQIVTASLLTGADIRKGALIELFVNRIADGKVFAEIRNEAVKQPDLEAKVQDLLMRLNLPVNEKNVEAAKLLVKYNLPVDKAALTELINTARNAESLKQADVSGKLGLLFSGIDIKSAPVEVLNKVVLLSEAEVKKVSEAQPVEQEDSIDTIQAKPTAEGEPITVEARVEDGDMVTRLIKKLVESEKRINQRAVEQSQPDTESDDATDVDIKNIDTKVADARVVDSMTAVTAGTTDIKTKTAVVEGAEGQRMQVEQQSEEDYSFERQALVLLKKLGIEAGQDIKQLIGQAAKALNAVSESNMEKLAFLISKDLEITPHNLERLSRNINNTDKISEFLEQLQQQVDSENNGELKEIKEDIRRIFLRPDQVEQKEDVKEQLKDIIRLGEKIEKLLERSHVQNTEIRETLSNLKDNIDFVKHVNQYNNYLQIPVMMNENTATAKLYVFKDGKRNKKVDPQNATILIALDLKHIGHIESLVNIHQKNVFVTFRIEDRKTGDLIDRQTGLLKDALSAKGYNLSLIKVINLDQPFNLISLEEMVSERIHDKMHIDMRV